MHTSHYQLLPERTTIDWGIKQSSSLWNNLYKRYNPQIDNKVILDLGCSWGYMLMYLLQHFNPNKVIGIDLIPFWDMVKNGWEYDNYKGKVEFYLGKLHELNNIQNGSIDYIFSTSVLQYMRPELVLLTLQKIYDLLRPGGELILRTRCFTSYIGADLHNYYNLDYIHLLYPLNFIKLDLKKSFNKDARYLNYLTSSNYIALFYQSGLEIMDIKRSNSSRSPSLIKQIQERFPFISSDDLLCSELEARLVRPMEPGELIRYTPS